MAIKEALENVEKAQQLQAKALKSAETLKEQAEKIKVMEMAIETSSKAMAMIAAAFCAVNHFDRANYGLQGPELLDYLSGMIEQPVRKKSGEIIERVVDG